MSKKYNFYSSEIDSGAQPLKTILRSNIEGLDEINATNARQDSEIQDINKVNEEQTNKDVEQDERITTNENVNSDQEDAIKQLQETDKKQIDIDAAQDQRIEEIENAITDGTILSVGVDGGTW